MRLQQLRQGNLMGVYIARRNVAVLRLSGRSLSFCGRWVSCSCAQRQTHALLVWTRGHFPNDCSLMNPRLELKEAQQRSSARRTERRCICGCCCVYIHPQRTTMSRRKTLKFGLRLFLFFFSCAPVSACARTQGPTFGNNPRSSPQNGPQERCQ